MIARVTTTAALKAVLAGLEAGREHEIDVGEPAGLRLRVKPSGVASWTFRYRAAVGQRQVTLGRWPAMGLAAARTEARKVLGRVASGDDPSAERKGELATRKGLTFGELAGSDAREHPRARPARNPPRWFASTIGGVVDVLSDGVNNDTMASVAELVEAMRANPQDVRFTDACRVASHFFGEPRQGGTSHHVWKMPWAGNPRVNLQRGKGGKAKAYQIRQLLEAIDRAEDERKEKRL